MKLLDWTYKFCRWFLGGLFIYAGGVKLLAPETFSVLIDAYGLVPDQLLMPVALALSALEIVAGVGLLFDIRGFLSVTSVLLILFIAILSYGILMGLDVDCGCFGPEDPEAQAFHGLKTSLYRDLAMLAVVVFIYGWRHIRPINPVTVNQLIIKRRT